MIINFNKICFNRKYIVKIQEAFDYAIKSLKVPCKDLEVNISFVGKKTIKQQNMNFRQVDKVTDVLSFPTLLEPDVTDEQIVCDKLSKENFSIDVNPDTNAIFIGDICICKPVVFAQAKEYGNSKERELCYMAVHGLLHLLGFDHMRDEDKKNMRKVEEKIMSHIKLGRD